MNRRLVALVVGVVVVLAGVGVWAATRPPKVAPVIGDDVDWKEFNAVFPYKGRPGAYRPYILEDQIREDKRRLAREKSPELVASLTRWIDDRTTWLNECTQYEAGIPSRLKARVVGVAYAIEYAQISAIEKKCPAVFDLLAVNHYLLIDADILAKRLREYESEKGAGAVATKSPTLGRWLANWRDR